MSNQQPSNNHRSLTGFVTKLVGDGATYGFINDEIFFPQTNVSGGPAAVGDQVYAECEFSAHLPIKWNATSVKILNKASGQHQSNSSGSDRQQADLQQFNQNAPAVAVTYQQHRQQRQQRQMIDTQQQPDNNAVKQNVEQTTTRLLDQANQGGGEYFNSNNQRAFQPQQQLNSNIQPFSDQPMGPPNFTYTSQLGSAFVQSPFVPAPFMAQPPPPMLPQQQQQSQQQSQQQQQQQHLLPGNQMHNQSNQRHNQHNKGNRYNNYGDKNNDRHNNNNANNNNNNRRNLNRNDNKFDRPRSGDRDGSMNNRSSKSNDRDRSAGRNSKRDDIPVRPSPPPHSSAISTTSISSDKVTKSRRHYEVHNIPKIQIMTNMNSYNMKQRCPSSVHVPSDLHDIIVNKHFRLDIKNTPKPIKFTIEQIKGDELKEISSEQKEVKSINEEPVKDDVEDGQIKTDEPPVIEGGQEISNEMAGNSVEGAKEEENIGSSKSNEQPTPPSSKSDVKLNHKYAVKVILISIPELDSIYHHVFGANLDSFSIESKSRSRLDEIITLLCNKGTNNGYSLIGGKFDPTLDGFIEGQTNEFERHGRQPDLIATCKRVVLDQSGLDLGDCRNWTLLSTFMYNNKSDYFSPKASVEYSFIYMPQIWSLVSDKFDKNVLNLDVVKSDSPTNEEKVESSGPTEMEIQESPLKEVEDIPVATTDTQDDSNNPSSSVPDDGVAVVNLENLSELKVVDLKAELDRRNIQYKGNAKKAELVSMLQECLKPAQVSTEAQERTIQQTEDESSVNKPEEGGVGETSQLEEGEVDADASENSPAIECDASADNSDSTGKRKFSEVDNFDDPQINKKACTDSNKKEKRVELIKESFIVRAKDDQQQLSLVSLHEAAQASKHDQFELSVASNILKESLVQHLSEYIFTTLVEDYKQKATSTSNTSVPSNPSIQETSNDTNNNSSKFKDPTTVSSESKANPKELPVNRYINLAFTYFDSSHIGYIYFEDLNKLFNNAGLTISKRALTALLGGTNDKFNYRTLPDLSSKNAPTYIYQFPEQFRRLPGLSPSGSTSEKPNLIGGCKMIEFKGVTYDVESLIQQVKDAETLRVSLVDRFNYAIENSDKQAEEIHVLEVSQKSLAKAIKAQNDEICDLKRERDSIKKKHENVRKGIKGTINSLSELVKDDK